MIARDEIELERLAEALLGVVEETMQPERFSLFLKPDHLLHRDPEQER